MIREFEVTKFVTGATKCRIARMVIYYSLFFHLHYVKIITRNTLMKSINYANFIKIFDHFTNWHKLCYYLRQSLMINSKEKGVIEDCKIRRGCSEVSEKEQV